MSRYLRLMLLSLGLLVLLFIGLAGLLLTSEQGLQLLWRQARVYLPAELSIDSVHGRILGPLVVRGVRYQDDQQQLTLTELELHWTPAALLAGRLQLNRLALSGMTFVQLAPTEVSEPVTLQLPDSLELPLALVVEDFSLRQAAYFAQPEAEPLELERVQLAAEADNERILVSRLTLNSPLLDIEGRTQLQNGRGYAVDGRYRWQLRLAEYPPLGGITELSGSLTRLLINQTLLEPYNTRAEITLDQPLGELRFEARLAFEALALQSLDPALPPYTLNAEIGGSGDVAGGRFNALLDTHDPKLGRVHVNIDGGVENGSLLIDRLALTLPEHAAAAEVSGRVLLDRAQPVAELKGSWQGLRWPLQGEPMIQSPAGNAEISGTLDDLSAVIDLTLAPEGRVQARVSHRQQQLDLQMDWRDLGWPQLDPRVKSPQGRIQAEGNLQDYRFSLDGEIDVPGQATGRLDLQGSGGPESVQLTALDLATLGGRVQGSAEIGWHPALAAKFKLSGRDIDPGKLFEGWAGQLALELQTAFEMRQNQLVVQASRLAVDGQLRGFPLRLQAQGGYDAAGLHLKTASLVSGATRLEASGQLGERLHLDWQAQSDDLASLSPDAAGRLQGSGRVQGALTSPHMVAALQGADLKYLDYTVARLKLDADLHVDGSAVSRLDLDIGDASLAGIGVRRLTLDGTGRPAAHRLRLDAITSQGNAELAIDGALLDPQWRFSLREGRLAYPRLEPWTLTAPADGTLSRDGQRVELSRSCWASDGAELCLGGRRSKQQLSAEFQLKALPFGYFSTLLPADIRVQGELSGRGSLQGSPTAENLQSDISLETSAGRLLSIDDDGAEELLLAFRPGRAGLKLARQGLNLEVNLPFAEAGGLDLDAAVAAGKGALLEKPLSGRLRILIPELAVFADLLPEAEKLHGRVQGDAKLVGTLAAPGFRGQLRLSDGGAELIAPGITLSAVQAQLDGGDGGDIQVSAEARSGQGRLQVKGTAKAGSGALSADLAITGEDFQVLDIPEAVVRVSPDLKLLLSDKRLSVEGDLRVPYARVKLKALPDSAVTVSSDQVIVQEQSAAAAGPAAAQRKIDARLRLLLGDRVTFDGFGLKARFEGNLLLIEQPGKLTTASGKITIPEGSYRAYGQNLTVERGQLRYAGGLVTEPGLDIRAVRRPAPDVLVGVQTRGTLKKPEFELFSEPAMSQSEQLSYLVLGQPLQGGTSSNESNAMNQAAIALGLAGGGAVAESLGEQFGFDTVGVEKGPGESTEEASLVVGKFLSPKLYVSYGVGLFDPVSTIWLRYTISSNWKLVSETSSLASGADLYYTIDRGR